MLRGTHQRRPGHTRMTISTQTHTYNKFYYVIINPLLLWSLLFVNNLLSSASINYAFSQRYIEI